MEKCTPEEVGVSSERLERINSKMQQLIDDGRLAGTVSLVARRGKVVHFKKLGMQDIAANKSMELDTIFRIFSMTKPITSVGLMMLYEKALFHLTDPVSKFIPEFKNVKVYVDEKTLIEPKRETTIQDLLRHTAGFSYGGYSESKHPMDAMYDERKVGSDQSITLGDMVRQIAEIPLLYHPGRDWRYSYATDVAGHVLEVIADRPIADYFEENIFRPLGMTDTAFTISPAKEDRLAEIYGLNKDGQLGVMDKAVVGDFSEDIHLHQPGAGLVSTAADYLRFGKLVMNQGELDGVRLLGRKTMELMTMNHVPHDALPIAMGEKMPGVGFGLGFSVLMDPGQAGILGSIGNHGWGGWASTKFWADPQEELIGIFMAQYIPNDAYSPREDFYTLVYQALID